MHKTPSILSWSGGKDCMLALESAAATHEISTLLSICTQDENRVSMHNVPYSLVKQQADALGITSERITLPAFPSNVLYEHALKQFLESQKLRGVNTVLFGDIFLEDLRTYRTKQLQRVNMTATFPLWGSNTRELLLRFINSGWRALVVCIDDRALHKGFLGRELNEGFLNDLPAQCDPCGENGEFHTFVFDGPLFKQPIEFTRGSTHTAFVHFHYLDLLDSQAHEQ